MSSRPVASAWVRTIPGAVLAVHGAIHVMGFLMLWEISEFGDLTHADASPTLGTTAARLVGIVWLVAAVAFVAAGFLLSIPVLIPVADAAAAGLVLDLLILGAAPAGNRIRVPLGSRT